MIYDPDVTGQIGALLAGRNADGAVVGVIPLLGGRGRVIRGDLLTVQEFW